jgi:hypothetical protein
MNTLWPFIAPAGVVIFSLSSPKLFNNHMESVAFFDECDILIDQGAMVFVEYLFLEKLIKHLLPPLLTILRFFELFGQLCNAGNFRVTNLPYSLVKTLNKFAPRYFLYRANRALRPGRLIGVQGRRIPVRHAANGEYVLVLAYGFGYQISQLH